MRGDFNHLFQVTEPLLIRGVDRNEGLLLAQLLLENQHEKPDYAEALGNALSYYILNHMNIQNPVEQAVSRIIQALTAQYNDPCLSVTDLLNQSGYAEDYIRACFKRTVGSTPNGYLTILRIRHACQMIDAYKTVIPLSEVAEQSGYLDYVNFCRRFKQVMGISPQQYKNKTQLDWVGFLIAFLLYQQHNSRNQHQLYDNPWQGIHYTAHKKGFPGKGLVCNAQ